MKNLFALCKPEIAALSTLSAATGFILASAASPALPILAAGVFLLACGSCALNHYQERHLDARMERTRNRPIPSGKIRPGTALLSSIVLLFSGFSILVLMESLWVIALGTLAVIWYNGFYTFMKRKTAFAAVPGGMVGALPPAMGWVAGGGSLSDPRLPALVFFFFMWQVPHFWLFLLGHEEDYRRTGLPVLTGIFSRRQLARLTSQWTAAAAVSALLIPLYGLVSSPAVVAFLIVSSFWFGLQGVTLLRTKEARYCAAFKKTGFYLLLVMLILMSERLDVLQAWP